MRTVAALSSLLVFATVATAQERLQSELGQMQGQLRQVRAEQERLMEMRVRHDLGLAGDERDDRTFRTQAPANGESMERLQQEKDDQESAVLVLNEQYEKLRAAVDQLKAATEARLKAEAGEQAMVAVPQAGIALPRGPGQVGATPHGESAPPSASSAQPPRPSETDVATLTVNAPLAPIVAQIHGSNDHQRVAQALFRAGQELMRVAATARAQGQLQTAKELDDRGREKLVRAIAELEPLLATKEPPFPALFYLGRCREMLFRYAELHEQLSPTGSSRDYARREQEVREPFLAITARDVVKSGPRSDVDVLGDWGKAAQTAMTNFTWVNQHASYDAMATIKALTWPGER